MLFRAADQSWRDAARLLAPTIRAAPAVGFHQWVQQFTHSGRLGLQRIRPGKMLRQILADADEHHARAELGHAVIRRVQQPPTRRVTQLAKLLFDFRPIIAEHRVEQPPHIFQHHRLRANFIDQAQSFGKQIALVIGAKLLARFGKGRTGDATRQQIHALVRATVKIPQIAFDNVPARPVQPQRGAGRRFDLHQPRVIETGALQPQRLPTSPSADFQRY
jgi:hypothetical protein